MTSKAGALKRKTSALADSEAARKESYNCFLTFLSGGKGRKPINNQKADDAKKKRLEYRFNCKYCEKPFRYKCDLTRHERVHTNERPFECNQCGKKFKQRGTLNAHKLHHTGDRPFFCYICGKRFRQKSILLNHYRNHTSSEKREANNSSNPNQNILNQMNDPTAKLDNDKPILSKKRGLPTSDKRLRVLFAGHSCANCDPESITRFKKPKIRQAMGDDKQTVKQRKTAIGKVDVYMCPIVFVKSLQLLDPKSEDLPIMKDYDDGDDNDDDDDDDDDDEKISKIPGTPSITIVVKDETPPPATTKRTTYSEVDTLKRASFSTLQAQVKMNNNMREDLRRKTHSFVTEITETYKAQRAADSRARRGKNELSSFRLPDPISHVNTSLSMAHLPASHIPLSDSSYEFHNAPNIVSQFPFQNPGTYQPHHGGEHSAFMRVPMTPPPNFVFPHTGGIPFANKIGPTDPIIKQAESFNVNAGPFVVGNEGADQMMHATTNVTPMFPNQPHENVQPTFPSHLPHDVAPPLPQHHFPTDEMPSSVLPPPPAVNSSTTATSTATASVQPPDE